MTDALEDHEGTVSIGGRTTTNFCFPDDIDGIAGEEKDKTEIAMGVCKKQERRQ